MIIGLGWIIRIPINRIGFVKSSACMLQRKFTHEAVKGQVDNNLHWPRRKTRVEVAWAHRPASTSHMVGVDSALKLSKKNKVTGSGDS
jgi:hypothetical protein